MEKWNLDALYTSFNSKEFQSSIVLLNKMIEDINNYALNEFKNTNNAKQKIKRYIDQSEKISSVLAKTINYCTLVLSVDAINEEAKRYLSILQKISAKRAYSMIHFTKWVPQITDLDKLIESDKMLEEIKYYLTRIVASSKHILSDKEEIIISQLIQTGSKAWGLMQAELTSSLKVDFAGRKITLAQARGLASNKDPKVRKAAYDAELLALSKVSQSLAHALSGVKGETNRLCDLRGHKSPLDQTLFNLRLERSTVEALIESMKEYLPRFRKYLIRKGELLGHKNGLPYYDVFAPIGESEKKYTIDEAMNYVYNGFRSFSPELEKFAKRAKDEKWIDFIPKKGKRNGAFCSNIQSIKQSRILTNFTGSLSDVITIAHELGHAYHGEQIFNERVTNTRYTMPVAETASTLCETIIKKTALKEASKEEKLTILEKSISDSTQLIVDILSMYIFENNLFEKRKSSHLNSGMINDMMLKAQIQTYGGGLDHNYLMPYAWVNKSHLFRGNSSYFNLPYAFGLLFSNGIYAEFLKEGKPYINKVNLLLRKTGQMSVEDVAKLIGIDVSKREFWNNSLDIIVEDINMFLDLTNK